VRLQDPAEQIAEQPDVVSQRLMRIRQTSLPSEF
jgi:hypothetical protein